MAKILTIVGLAVTGLLILIFGLDLGLGIPLAGISKKMDILMLVAAAILGYMSWTSFREQK